MTNPNTTLIEVMWDALKREACATPPDSDKWDEVTTIVQLRKPHLARALNAIQSSGMVVVPVEPSEAMQNAGVGKMSEDYDYTDEGLLKGIYRAMIQASQQ